MIELAPSPSLQVHPPHGLLSLWDMLELRAIDFYAGISALAALEHLLSTLDKQQGSEDRILGETKKALIKHLDSLLVASQALGAPVTHVAISRLQSNLKKSKCTYSGLLQAVKDIRSRLKDEIGSSKLFGLTNEEGDLYAGGLDAFAFDVATKFSQPASEDIDEACKCLALGRTTACVFHLMRAMEAAVQRLSNKLGIPNVEREWGKLLSDIAAKIEKMPKGSERDEWSSCHVNLYHVKQAWRNSTMHPKETYSEEQAKEVLSAVRQFMRQLQGLI